MPLLFFCHSRRKSARACLCRCLHPANPRTVILSEADHSTIVIRAVEGPASVLAPLSVIPAGNLRLHLPCRCPFYVVILTLSKPKGRIPVFALALVFAVACSPSTRPRNCHPERSRSQHHRDLRSRGTCICPSPLLSFPKEIRVSCLRRSTTDPRHLDHCPPSQRLSGHSTES